MKKEFISYKQALSLKNLGFDEPCLGYFVNGKNMLIVEDTNNRNYALEPDVVAPLFQQAFKWFREKHKLNISIYRIQNYSSEEYCWRIQMIDNATKTNFSFPEFGLGEAAPDYRKAEIACLNKLIKITIAKESNKIIEKVINNDKRTKN